MLKNACEDLREEFDLLNSERMNIANKNFLPKYADARENPSRKVLLHFSRGSLCVITSFREATKLAPSRCSMKYSSRLSGLT